MDFHFIQNSLRPARESGLQLLAPILMVLISGLVIILAVSPQYLRDLHPLTLLLLSVACALPAWALNQLLWWHVGQRISGEIVVKIAYVLDVPKARKEVYGFALARILKSLNVLRFVPYRDIANMVTVIAIYAGSALCYLTGAAAATLYGCILGLSILVWIGGLLALHWSCREIDVEPLRELWHELKNKDELLATINEHAGRMEKLLMAQMARTDGLAASTGTQA